MQPLSINNLAATSITGDGEKDTDGPKFFSATLLATSAKAAALNIACALSAGLKGGCPLLFSFTIS